VEFTNWCISSGYEIVEVNGTFIYNLRQICHNYRVSDSLQAIFQSIKPCTVCTSQCMNHAPAILATLALTYSTHWVLVVWIIVTHFHLCSLLGTLSRYTILEVSAIRRLVRVCCGSRWGWCVLFTNNLDSFTAHCLVYNTTIYTVYCHAASMAGAWFIHSRCGWSKKRQHDGMTGQTTGHLEVDTPRATVPSLSTCNGHTMGHRPVAF